MVRKILLSVLVIALGTDRVAHAEHRISNTPLATCAGTSTDSGGAAGSYANGETFVQTIWPSRPGNRVRLDFASFASEDFLDQLRIHNGHNVAAPQIWSMTGTPSPEVVTSTAPDGSLTLRWVSSPSGVAAGWVATISCVPGEQRMRSGFVTLCDGRFTDSGGPSGPYGPDETFALYLYPDQPNARLEVLFGSWTVGPGETLNVYDGSSTSAPSLGVFSASSVPVVLRATNSEGALLFLFFSDSGGTGAGWDALTSCALPLETAPAERTTCGGTFTDSGGSGGNYSPNEWSTVVFRPSDPGARIELRFTSFETEALNDVVELYDGSGPTPPYLGTFSGTTSPGTFTSTASDGSLTVYWSSDGSIQRPGWQASVRCVYPIHDDLITTCGATATDTGGRFGNYGNLEFLAQGFAPAMPRSRIALGFSSFNSEPGYDQMSVRDGDVTGPVLASLDGAPAMPATFRGSHASGDLVVRWTSDVSNVSTGWVANATCDPPLVVDEFESGDLLEWAAKTP